MIRVTFYLHCGHSRTVFVPLIEINRAALGQLKALCSECDSIGTYSQWDVEVVNFN